MSFTPNEIDYLKGRLLGRLATVGPNGAPHVTAVGVFVDTDNHTIAITGHIGTGMARSKKFRDAARHPQVAFLVDDLASLDPWTPRGIEIRGLARTHTSGGEELEQRLDVTGPFDPAWISIHPTRILTYGIDTDAYDLTARNVT